MKATVGVVAASLFAIACASVPPKPSAPGIAVDFTMADSGLVIYQPLRVSRSGHSVASKGRVRIDMEGMPIPVPVAGFANKGPVSMLILDNGTRLVYLSSETKQYTQFNPMEMMDQLQKLMASVGMIMKIEFTGDPKVEDLGSGPEMVGHKTEHYRVTTGMRMTITGMGLSHAVERRTLDDKYIARDLAWAADPFRHIMPITGASGSFARLYDEAMDRLHAKLGNGAELRSETRSTTIDDRGSRNMTTIRQVTRIGPATASDDMFTIPNDYKKVEFPLASSATPRQ